MMTKVRWATLPHGSKREVEFREAIVALAKIGWKDLEIAKALATRVDSVQRVIREDASRLQTGSVRP